MSNKYCNILDLKIIDQKIDDAMEKALDSGKEFGFNFCSKDGTIVSTDVEEGGEYSLGIETKCPKGTVIGAFHVHTIGKDAIPSPNDILKGITDDDITFFCIGARIKEDNIVRCFTKDDLSKEIKGFLKESILDQKKIIKISKNYF